jgi:hypothetical protein
MLSCRRYGLAPSHPLRSESFLSQSSCVSPLVLLGSAGNIAAGQRDKIIKAASPKVLGQLEKLKSDE